MPWSSRVVTLVLLVTTALVAGDHVLHVGTDTLVHHWRPQIDGQTVWVVPMFAAAAVAMLALAAMLPSRSEVETWWPFVLAVVLFEIAYWATGQWGDTHGTLLTVVLVVTWIGRVAVTSAPRRTVVLASALLALTGPAVEGLVSIAGMFDYRDPDVLGVPWWLFALYLHGGPAVVAMAGVVRSARGSAVSARHAA